MDDRHFDDLSRRIGELALSRAPRRALMAALGGTALAGALGWRLEDDVAEAKRRRKKKNKRKKCKKDGKKCKRNKDCCKNLKCQNKRCGGSSGNCPTKVEFNFAWDSFTPTSGPGTFAAPWGIASDTDGFLYVTDTNNERVLIFNQSGTPTGQFGTEGSEDDEFETPFGIGVNFNNSGNKRVIVADPGQPDNEQKLRQFRTSGAFEGNLGVGSLSNPMAVAVDDNDRIWAVDSTGSARVFRYGPNGGTNPTIWNPGGSGSLSSPQGLALYRDSDDELYLFVADTGNQRVVKFRYANDNSDGLEFVDAVGSAGGGSNSFNQPTGITTDRCGNVYVADRLNNRLQQLDKNLSFKSRITSSFSRPTGVAIPRNSNLLYVVDSDNNRIVSLNLVK